MPTLDQLLRHLGVGAERGREVVGVFLHLILFLEFSKHVDLGLLVSDDILVTLMDRQNGLLTIALLFPRQNLL